MQFAQQGHSTLIVGLAKTQHTFLVCKRRNAHTAFGVAKSRLEMKVVLWRQRRRERMGRKVAFDLAFDMKKRGPFEGHDGRDLGWGRRCGGTTE